MSAPAIDAVRDRARAIAPGIRERALAAEEAREVPRASVDELLEIGTARLLVPQERGGEDLPLEAWFDVALEISRACPSTGWCASLLAHLPHVLGMWPQEAQEDLWSAGPDVAIAISVAPTTEVKVVPGGYRISGASPFTSGVAHSDRVGVGGMVVGEAGPDWHWFILPADSYTVQDVWQTSAMRGTGSNVVLTDDVFVPDTHAVRVVDIREGTGPGGAVNADPKFRLPFASYSGLFATAVMLGATLGAFDTFRGWLSERRTPTGERLAGAAAMQTGTARIQARLDASELIQRNVIAATRADDVAGLEARAKAVADLTFAADLTIAAIDDIVTMSGTSAFALDNPVQRAWRDVHMAAAHISISPHNNYGHRGRMLLDVPIEPAPAIY